MIGLSREVVRCQLSLPVLVLLLILSPRLHTLVRAAHPLTVRLHFLDDLLSLFLLLLLMDPPHSNAFLVASLIQIVVLLRFALSLLVLSEHAHDFLLDRNIDLRGTHRANRHIGQRVGIHSLFDESLVVLDHALPRSLD